MISLVYTTVTWLLSNKNVVKRSWFWALLLLLCLWTLSSQEASPYFMCHCRMGWSLKGRSQNQVFRWLKPQSNKMLSIFQTQFADRHCLFFLSYCWRFDRFVEPGWCGEGGEAPTQLHAIGHWAPSFLVSWLLKRLGGARTKFKTWPLPIL